MGNENQSMAMLNTYGQYTRQVHRCLHSLQIAQSSSGSHHTLQVQLDMATKANGYGWQEFQDKQRQD